MGPGVLGCFVPIGSRWEVQGGDEDAHPAPGPMPGLEMLMMKASVAGFGD